MKDDTDRAVRRTGIGVATIVTLIFMVLKLTGYIDWKWVWIFSPLWLPISIALVGVLVISFVLVILESLNKKSSAKDKE